MKRIPTMSMNVSGFSFSKVVPETLGDDLGITVDKENKQLIITKETGQFPVKVKYPSTIPIIKSMALVHYLQDELGDLNYSKMPLEWQDDKFIAKVGEK